MANDSITMHICFIGQYPLKNQTAGGVGTFTQTLAKALVGRGIQVTVLALHHGVEELAEDQDGVQVYWINQQKWPLANFVRNSWILQKNLKKVHQRQPISVVESQEAGFAFLQPLPGVPFVIRLHGGHYFFSKTLGKSFRAFTGWQERQSFKKATAYIGVSHFVLNETAKYIPINTSKAVVIPNPIDCKRFYAANPKNAKKGALVFAGRLVEKKGIRQLIEALPLVLEKHPNIRLLVYGGDTTIDHGTSFKTMLENQMPATIRPVVQFMGEVKNEGLPALLEEAEICVYPSHMEAMPIAWLEVMAMGKPFIAGRPGPGPEVIDDGEDGLLCDPYSPADIAQKIIWMLEHPIEAEQMGLKSRQKILRLYEINQIVLQNIDFFRKVSGTVE